MCQLMGRCDGHWGDVGRRLGNVTVIRKCCSSKGGVSVIRKVCQLMESYDAFLVTRAAYKITVSVHKCIS